MVAGDRWSLAEPGQLDPDSLLVANLRLTSAAGTVFERRPRRLVPLVRDDLLQAHVEAERLTMGSSGLVLCPAALAPTVDRALTVIARPGFTRWTEPPVGAPREWTVFSDIQVMASLPDVDAETGRAWPTDLNQLQPLGTSQVVIEGGLRLPGRVVRWSSLVAPELRVVTTDAARLDIEIRQVRPLAEPVSDLAQSLAGPVASVDLSRLGLPDGDYEVRVSTRTSMSTRPSLLDLAHLRLRSADTPNPAPPPFDCDTAAGPFPSAARERDQPNEASDHVPHWWTGRAARTGGRAETAVARIVVPSTGVAACVQTGAHYMEIAEASRSATVAGTCRDCGLVKRYPAHYHPSRAAGSGRGGRRAPAPRFDATRIPRVHTLSVSPDAVLDALSHDRCGAVAGLHRLAVQVDASPLIEDKLARALETLGHLRICHGTHASTAHWVVTRAALLQTAPDSFVLTGARSRRLQAALEIAANDLVERQDQQFGPARIRVVAGADKVSWLAEQLLEVVGVEVDVVHDTPRLLASTLSPLSDLVGSLPRQPMPGYRRCQRWDADTARWIDVSTGSTPGVFRLLGGATTYCVRDEPDVAGGSMRRGDARTVKYAAALASGQSLVGYDAAAESLYVPLGADLPEPFARVAVSCSGLLPDEDRSQGVTRYHDVPPRIAGVVITRLSR